MKKFSELNSKNVLIQKKRVFLQYKKEERMESAKMKDKIKANVLEVDPSAEVWLYGSRARGTAREDSDWDILVLTPDKQLTVQDESRFIDHMCELIVSSGQAIQLFAYGKEDWHTRHCVTPFYQSIQEEAIRL